ncbi:hypothetical protein NPIL_531681, partial [Nephila pilipes]
MTFRPILLFKHTNVRTLRV